MASLSAHKRVQPCIPDAESIGERDDVLLAGIRAGDEHAFEALYRAYYSPLWQLAYGHARSREAAEELVHDVFLALWRRRLDVEIRESLRAWLYGATRNRALKYVRHRAVLERVDRAAQFACADAGESGSLSWMGEPLPTPEGALRRDEIERAMELAVRALPERRRLAITLRWKRGFSAAEIARVLGTSSESVRVLLLRARRDLHVVLESLRAGG